MTYLGPSLRRARKRTRRPWLRIGGALVLSLGVNYAILRLVPSAGLGQSVRVGERPPQDVVLAPLSAQQWAANRRAPPPRPPRPVVAPRPPEPPPPPRHVSGQVVDVAPSKNQTPPKDSRFLAEQDSSVEKETRSRHAGHGQYENALPKPASPTGGQAAGAAPPPVAAAPTPGKAGKPGAASAAAPEPPRAPGRTAEQPGRERLALRSDPRGDIRLQPPRPGLPGGAPPPGGAPQPAPQPGDGGEGGQDGTRRPPTLAELRPSASAYDRLAGGPQSDKLDGVEEGEGTFLNTRAWKYSSYMNRIKRAVASEWEPRVNSAYTSRDPTGTKFGAHDWTTELRIRLDDQGSLKEVTVRRSCGLPFLDDAAVQAFQQAQPFVNPPRGLAENGEIAFGFGFTYSVGRGGILFGRVPVGAP